LPVVLGDASPGLGGAWGENGAIVFAPEDNGGLELVSSAGGAPQVLTTPDTKKGESAYRWPQLLPGGNEVLFSILGTTRTDVRIVVQSLKTRERRVLLQGAATARYVVPGYLAYSQNGTLMAAPLDVRRLELTGTPVPVVENVAERLSAGFSFSGVGSLVYIPRASTNF